MKRSIFVLSLMLAFCTSINAQTTTTIWNIFCSLNCDFETLQLGEIQQDFIEVKQQDNIFYWGNDNVYKVYNKEEIHSGFTTITTYDFIDRYSQRGKIIYQYNRGGDWATKHMFYVQYEGVRMGKVYYSREPKKK